MYLKTNSVLSRRIRKKKLFPGERAYYLPQKNVVAEGTGYTGNENKDTCSKERVNNSLG